LAKAGTLAAHQQFASGGSTQGKVLQKAPSAAILDAQTVKMADQPGARGFDAGKKVLGQKRTFWLTPFT
jgi:hypothetical protein